MRSLWVVVVSATALAAVRWDEDYHLFFLGLFSFAAAWWGRTALRQSLAQLDCSTRHRNGNVFYSAPDRVLRGQWRGYPALERASTNCLLAITERGGAFRLSFMCSAAPLDPPDRQGVALMARWRVDLIRARAEHLGRSPPTLRRRRSRLRSSGSILSPHTQNRIRDNQDQRWGRRLMPGLIRLSAAHQGRLPTAPQ